MKNLNIRLLFLVLLGSTFFTSSAQREQRTKGILVRNNTQKLTQKVIKNSKTDREKVAAIHGWITNNIAYDIDKYSGQDFDRTKTNRILRKRKAICLGYSDLFTSMCGYAGIQSTMVPGYVKTLQRDIGDTFYLDDHAWNAVKIDDVWFLIDNTWDAGYVRWYKPNFLTKMARHFKKINYAKYVYDPKFIFAPHKTYFLKSGEDFSLDHLASMPIWQLLPESITIEQWRTDSTFYLGQVRAEKEPIKTTGSEREQYAAKNEIDKMIYQGEYVYDFNTYNHYIIGGSLFYEAQKLYIGLKEDESKSKSGYEKAYALGLSAVEHADSNEAMLKQELGAQLRNHKVKKDLHLSYNKMYKKTITNDEKRYKVAKRKLQAMDKSNKNYLELKESKTNKILEENTFRDKEFKHRYENVQDSIIQDSVTEAAVALFYQKMEAMDEALRHFDSQKDVFLIQLVKETDYVKDVAEHFAELSNIRLVGYDDFDHPLITIKSNFKALDDNLFFGDGITVLDSFKVYQRTIVKQIKEFHNAYKEVNRQFKNLKKMSSAKSDLDERWRIVTNEYIEVINAAGEWHVQLHKDLHETEARYKTIRNYAKITLKIIANEESYAKPNDDLKERNKALISANKHLKSIATKVARKSQKEIDRLQE